MKFTDYIQQTLGLFCSPSAALYRKHSALNIYLNPKEFDLWPSTGLGGCALKGHNKQGQSCK